MRSIWSLAPLGIIFAASFAHSEMPRPEHPRPDFVRPAWTSLNGSWEFQFDDRDQGPSEKWYRQKKSFERTIQVPYCFQSKLSGVGDTSFHDVFWYKRIFQVPSDWKGKRIRLCFGAVDYRCQVWVNGESQGMHEGGQTPFSFDITASLYQGAENTIVVRAEDPSTDVEQEINGLMTYDLKPKINPEKVRKLQQ